MVDIYGRWYPDYPGQLPQQDPAYLRSMRGQMQPQQAQQQAQAQQMQQPTIQQSGFVLVPSEQEARNYPVAPGNSVTFKDENAPYCYVKTMGFNQLDRPTFERYRLVKEDSPVTPQNVPTNADGTEGSKDTAYALKSDVAALWGAVDEIREKIKQQPGKKPVKTKKLIEAEAEEDDE